MSLSLHASICQPRVKFGLCPVECLPEGLTCKKTHPFLQSGFTLIELLAVLTLLAIIATITTVSISDVGAEAQDDLSHIEAAEIRKALHQFRRNVGHFPDAAGNHDDNTRLRLLWVCQAADTVADDYDAGCQDYNLDTKRGWNGPYLLSERNANEAGLFDPWGAVYLLLDPQSATPGAGKVRIVSTGPNKQYDGENANACQPNGDDIVLCLVR